MRLHPATLPIALAAALAAALVMRPPVPPAADRDDQSQAMRVSERWLDAEAFRREQGGGAISAPLVAAHDFSTLGVAWQGRGGRGEVRASSDGQRWGGWIPLIDDHHGSAPGQPAALADLGDGARFVQLRFDAPPAGAALTFIAPGGAPPPQPAAPASAAGPGEVPKPPVVTRTAWGCPDGQGSRWAPVASEVGFLIVHHSAGSNSSSDWAATVRGIWSFHTITRGWGDVGYNFLIDPDGVIYEGRAGGDDTIGAHFSCTNSGTMGVCLMGDFTSVEPTPAALESLAQLLAWKACKESIDPAGQGFHSASGLGLDRISGHRDGNPGTQGCASGTVCPGAQLYPLLPGVRGRAASIVAAAGEPQLGSGGYSLADPAPGGDGDGVLEPGERFALAPALRHLGGGPAAGLQAEVTTADPYLQIFASEAAYPDLADGATADATFGLGFPAQTPHGHRAAATVTVTAANGGPWTFPLQLPPVFAPPAAEVAGVSLEPGEVRAGGGAWVGTAAYQVEADRAFGARFELALLPPGGGELPLTGFASAVAAGPQIKTRALALPPDLAPGRYGLRVAVRDDTDPGGGPPLVARDFADVLAVLSEAFPDWAARLIPDPAQRGGSADPDRDTLPNLLEYALMLDPSAPSPDAGLQIGRITIGSDEYATVQFAARAFAPELRFEVEVTADGVDWAWGALPVAEPTPLGGGRELHHFRAAQPLDAEPRQQLRLRVGLQ